MTEVARTARVVGDHVAGRPGPSPAAVPRAAGRRMVSPTLVGRERELTLLRSAVATPPTAVVVEGEAGIGKTRLITELQRLVEMSQRRFVTGSCRRIREPFPLGPVIEAVRDLGPHLPTAKLSPVAGALRPLLPEIARRLPAEPPPLHDRAAERHRVFRALVELLASLGPAVLVLEDLHWADEATVDFLSYLLAGPPAELSLVVTFRGEDADPRVPALTAKLPESVGRAEVDLRPLGEHDTAQLAAAILGVHRVSSQFAGYLHRNTSGLPLAVEELLALLLARGTLDHLGGDWSRAALSGLGVPTGIRDSVRERASRLSDDARSVVAAAAVLQTPSPAEVLTATCDASRAGVARALEEVLDSGLLVEDGDEVGFRHLLAAQAMYEALSGPRRRTLHHRAARALRMIRPAPLGRIAHHLRHADQLDAWADVAGQAADQAVELGHDTEAVRLLQDVLRHARLSPERQGRLALRLARAATETVEITAEVTSLLAEVLEVDLPKPVRGELCFRLALLHEATGADASQVRGLYTAAIGDLDDSPDLMAWAMMGLAIPTAADVPLCEHRRWLQRVLRTLPRVADPGFAVFLRGKAAMVLVLIGDPRWRGVIERIEADTSGRPRRRHEVNAYQSIGMAACYAGHLRDADRLLTAALSAAATGESRKLALRVESAQALLDYFRGCWDRLDDRVGTLLGDLADYPAARIDVDVAAGCLALARGDVPGAERRLAEVADEAQRVGAFELTAVAVSALARSALVRGAGADAVARLHRFLATVRAKELWMPVAWVLGATADVLVAAGQESEVRALVTRCARELADTDAPLLPAALAHAHGVIDAAADSWSAAAGHFLTAAGHYDRLQFCYDAAQARERAAGCLFVAGDGRAERTLRDALATYQRLGASWDVARAASIARRHGLAVPARHRGGRRGYGDRLSPREREVAELAATGRTNREIAQALFLSPKTVDKHISAALRKLALRSRGALVGALAGGPAPEPVDLDGGKPDRKNGVASP